MRNCPFNGNSVGEDENRGKCDKSSPVEVNYFLW